MQYVHIFAADGRHIACIKTSTPARSARNWLRQHGITDATWYAAPAAS